MLWAVAVRRTNSNMIFSSIDIDHQLYVSEVHYNGKLRGYSHLGWTYLDNQAKQVAQWLDPKMPIDWAPLGTEAHFNQCKAWFKVGAEEFHSTGRRCPVELTEQLNGLEGMRVEVSVVGGTTAYRFWVGRSTGWLPCHIELTNSRSRGGNSARKKYGSVRVIRTHR